MNQRISGEAALIEAGVHQLPGAAGPPWNLPLPLPLSMRLGLGGTVLRSKRGKNTKGKPFRLARARLLDAGPGKVPGSPSEVQRQLERIVLDFEQDHFLPKLQIKGKGRQGKLCPKERSTKS
ncbi:MAG: hypothetical protein K9J37_10405 [Saprospiraceae bacterium]|nr:hypothetical protein [Saprospiraceae bacterium]MCF8250315.1 hypothetical protein [Saprospiraceae bacterium]MCF8280960.1 hypothetical protein [Bacteroidales bacterium]MCF8312053.1 hypothetical protein [Saprospiraceae bacterium]MCF8440460.1 hypothetical protein [Saprospiraceae bacterium]